MSYPDVFSYRLTGMGAPILSYNFLQGLSKDCRSDWEVNFKPI